MIKKNDGVTLSYTLKNSTGVELGKAEAKDAMNYLHGAGNIVPGLEEAIEGLGVGDKKENVLPLKIVEGDRIFVDGNHPLAGETPHFNVEILGVREATAEELSQGSRS